MAQYTGPGTTTCSPVQRKIHRVAQDRQRAKSRATSMERLSRTEGYKLCIYVNSS